MTSTPLTCLPAIEVSNSRMAVSVVMGSSLSRGWGGGFLVDVVDEVEEAGEVVELARQVVRRVALEVSAQRADTGVAVEAEPIADELVSADKVGAKSDGG